MSEQKGPHGQFWAPCLVSSGFDSCLCLSYLLEEYLSMGLWRPLHFNRVEVSSYQEGHFL